MKVTNLRTQTTYSYSVEATNVIISLWNTSFSPEETDASLLSTLVQSQSSYIRLLRKDGDGIIEGIVVRDRNDQDLIYIRKPNEFQISQANEDNYAVTEFVKWVMNHTPGL